MKIDKKIMGFAIFSVIICILTLRHTGEPRPILVATSLGFIMSVLLNLGLLLVSIEKLRKRYKLFFTVWMVVSLLGVILASGGYLPYNVYLILFFHFFVIYKIWREGDFQVLNDLKR